MNGASGYKSETRPPKQKSLPAFTVIKQVSPSQTTPAHIPVRKNPVNHRDDKSNGTYTRSNSYSRDTSRDSTLVHNHLEYVAPNSSTHNSKKADSAEIKSNSNHGNPQIIDLLSTLREKFILEETSNQFDNLKEAILNELKDGYIIENSLKEADKTLDGLSTSRAESQELLNHYISALEDINFKYKIYTAENISECESGFLEDVLEKLFNGLQAATIALYQTPNAKAANETTPEKKHNLLGKLKKSSSFQYVVPPGISAVTGKSPEICSQIIENLQHLRNLQLKNVEKLKLQYLKASQSQKTIASKKKDYEESLENIRKYELQLKEKTDIVNQLSGAGDYSDLNEKYLQELGRKINRASRKIATELALRNFRDENAQSTLTASPLDKENCIVCFERRWNTTLSPCGHLLCDDCSARLNYCPQCRTKIESRQKCFQP